MLSFDEYLKFHTAKADVGRNISASHRIVRVAQSRPLRLALVTTALPSHTRAHRSGCARSAGCKLDTCMPQCECAVSAVSCRENSELAWQVARLAKERDSAATAVAKLEARLREAEVDDLPRVPRRAALPCTRCTLPCTRKGHPLPRAAPTRRNRPIAAVRG